MRFKVKVEGLKELDAALGELPKATAKNVLKRALSEAAQPIADHYAGHVRREWGDLADSTSVGTKLNRRQKRLHRKQSAVEVFVGPTKKPQRAMFNEFGTPKVPAQGAMRGAWSAKHMGALNAIRDALAAQIEKARARMAKKAARLLARAGT